jgi:hypothetical protein
MPLQRSSTIRSFLAATIVFGLSGCAAAPLVEIAASRMAPSEPACQTGPGCQTDVATSALGDLSKGVTASWHKLVGGASDSQTATAAKPVP